MINLQHYSQLALAAAFFLPSIALAQWPRQNSLASETGAEAAAAEGVPERYNIPLGAGGVDFSAHLRGVYVDNVYISHDNRRDDFILIPELDAGLFMPIGRLNTLVLNVGLSYYHYLDNDELNTEEIVVTPDTDLEFNIYTGDFRITLSEAFSYEVTPFYEMGGDFYNVYNTGLFQRFRNRAGVQATWDLRHLLIEGRYRHENFFSNGSDYEFIDRSSELFNLSALASLQPWLSAGIETALGLHDFDNMRYNDQLRVSVGPTVRARLTEFLTARAGAGYLRLDYDSDVTDQIGLDGQDLPYAYVDIEHEINRFIRHNLQVTHEHQVGVNAANLEGTHVRYGVTWDATPAIRVNPYASYSWYEESFGSGQNPALYHEEFDYVGAGFSVQWAFAPNWTTGVGYDYRMKDSEDVGRGYHYNRVSARLSYNF